MSPPGWAILFCKGFCFDLPDARRVVTNGYRRPRDADLQTGTSSRATLTQRTAALLVFGMIKTRREGDLIGGPGGVWLTT